MNHSHDYSSLKSVRNVLSQLALCRPNVCFNVSSTVVIAFWYSIIVMVNESNTISPTKINKRCFQ